MADARALSVPPFPRLSDYVGCWAMESTAFVALWEAARHVNLVVHVADGLERPPVPESKVQTVPASGGKSIAVISVAGPMMKSQSSFGGTSTVQLRRDVRSAAADPDVAAILLNIESPGGTVAGTFDLARDVRAARQRKPVWAHIDDLGASAAYWLASQAGQVFANSPTALVGSVGTLMTVYDVSGQAEQTGVKALVFATGPLKGAGVPGTAVTEEQQAYYQSIVDGSQREFDRAVQAGRGLTDAELAAVRTGAVWHAQEAKARKLIDGVRPLEKTIEALADAAGQRSKTA